MRPWGASACSSGANMGPPMASSTTSNWPSSGEPSPGWTSTSAPAARTAAPRCWLPAWPVTVALASTASCTANRPTPPAAPVTSTRSPAWTLASRRMPTAVTPATGRAAAVTKSQALGSGAVHSAGTTARSAKAPPEGLAATTRSPASNPVTPSPTAATVPATSQPITLPGGCARAVRISPRLIEAAATSTRSWPGPGAGSGTSARARAGVADGSATSARMAGSFGDRSTAGFPGYLPRRQARGDAALARTQQQRTRGARGKAHGLGRHVGLVGVAGLGGGQRKARPGGGVAVQQGEQPLEAEDPGEGLGAVADRRQEPAAQLPLAEPNGRPDAGHPARRGRAPLQPRDRGGDQRVGPAGVAGRCDQRGLHHGKAGGGRGGFGRPLLQLPPAPPPDAVEWHAGVEQLAGGRSQQRRRRPGMEP